MINAQALHGILDGYAAAFPAESSMVAELRNGIGSASREPSDRKTLPGHFTASALVLNRTFSKVLLVHHVLLEQWIQPGGHLELDDNLASDCARREAEEETGLIGLLRLFPDMLEVPFYIDSHEIPKNERKQEPPHIHYDLRYAFTGDDSLPLQHEAGATSGVAWVSIDKIHMIEPSVAQSLHKVLGKVATEQHRL